MALFCPDSLAVGTIADWFVAGGTLALFAVAVVGPWIARRQERAKAERRAIEQARRALAGRVDQLIELHGEIHERSTLLSSLQSMVQTLSREGAMNILSISHTPYSLEILDRLPEDSAVLLSEINRDIEKWNRRLQHLKRPTPIPVEELDGRLVALDDRVRRAIRQLSPFFKAPVNLPERYDIRIPFDDRVQTQQGRPPGMSIDEYRRSVE